MSTKVEMDDDLARAIQKHEERLKAVAAEKLKRAIECYLGNRKARCSHDVALAAGRQFAKETKEAFEGIANVLDEFLAIAANSVADSIGEYCTARTDGNNQAESSVLAKPPFVEGSSWDGATTEIESLLQIALIHDSANMPGLKPPANSSSESS